MASRDITNMHVFLDLKKKFPDLPDETLRNYISLFAEDQEKCLSLLQKESENHYHPSQPFPDFRLPEYKVNSIRNDYVKHIVQDSNESSSPAVNLRQLYIPTNNRNVPTSSSRSSSHAGIVHLPRKPLNQNIFSKPESLSAPVITNNERPFKDLYKQNSISSQATCQLPSNVNDQFIFQTTKNHIIEAPKTLASTAYLSVSGEPEQSRKHAVKLSITPSFPFHQQHINVYNNSIYTTASHSPRLDRHTTSVNFQIQPQTSSNFPLEISTIPTNLGQPCDSKDFCSHVQISVGEQGTTFTAVRLQHPNYSQTEFMSGLPVTDKCTSSQVPNSSLSSFSNRRVQLSPDSRKSQPFPVSVAFDQNQNMFLPKTHPSTRMNSIPSYQLPLDHVLDVKNQQIAQLDSILCALEEQKLICSQLRTEVNALEEKIFRRNKATSFPGAEDLQKLREEIKNLRIEVSCLSMEVDSAGEISLCVPDEDAYGPSNTSIKDAPENNQETLRRKSENKIPLEDDDEKNQWICKKCTFANHPALEKCEMCELPKNSGSFFGDK